MASDGNIDQKEIELIKSMCEASHLFPYFKFEEEINLLIEKLNKEGENFINSYCEQLKEAGLTEQEKLTLIDFALNTIKADGVILYSEIKFFKVIRFNLKISDEKILANHSDIENFLEPDIIIESYLDKVIKQYFDTVQLPQFKFIQTFDNKVFNKKHSGDSE